MLWFYYFNIITIYESRETYRSLRFDYSLQPPYLNYYITPSLSLTVLYEITFVRTTARGKRTRWRGRIDDRSMIDGID